MLRPNYRSVRGVTGIRLRGRHPDASVASGGPAFPRRGHRDGSNRFEHESGESYEFDESLLVRRGMKSERARDELLFFADGAWDGVRKVSCVCVTK